MSDQPEKPDLFEELKRRRVFRVATLYAVVAWLLIQIGEATFEPLGLPDGSLRFLIILVGLGFPVALVLGWIFDVTPAGIVRTSDDPAAERAQVDTHRRIDFVIIGALLLALGMALFGPELEIAGPGRDSIRSIAVLPLENLSGDEEQEYFADGMTDALIADLARVAEVRVTSRTSVMRFKGTRAPASEIAAQLGVDALIEGTVLRDGGRIRVTAKLIDARLDENVWADRYERDLADVLSIQSEIASVVAAQVEARVGARAERILADRRPVVPEAHEAYLKGRYYAERHNPSASIRSRNYYEEAMRIDPEYPLAYAGLADNLSCAPLHTWVVPAEGAGRVPMAVMDLAQELALRAQELDPGLPETHVALGLVRVFRDWDWEQAERLVELGLELNPSFEFGYRALALVHAHQGHFDHAIPAIQEALRLDPLNPLTTSLAGDIHGWAGQTDRAMDLWQEATALDDSHPLGRQGMGVALCRSGRTAEGLEQLEVARRVSEDDPLVVGDLGYCHGLAGNTETARRLLEELEARAATEWVSPVALARIHLALGHNEDALAALEHAFEVRAYRVLEMKIDPRWDPIRADPRFHALLVGTGLAEESQQGEPL